MLYSLPRTAASSAVYWESLADVTHWLEGPLGPDDRVDAPAGCAIFPHAAATSDPRRGRRTLHRHPPLERNPSPVGHFPALEQPETFAG